jgi:cyclopropane fatty-acyl-phospholipid synthase-like methyltransferase
VSAQRPAGFSAQPMHATGGNDIVSGGSGSVRRAAMYGENDLSSKALFAGNFINFGYWEGFADGGQPSVEDRIASQANLYRTVLRSLDVDPTDVVTEVGCGIGVGAALALREFHPHAVHGVDLSPAQIDRAHRINGELIAQRPNQLVLRQGSALALPYPDKTFEKCYSVEAAQHFEDLRTFGAEAHRVLKSRGRLAVATFFMPHAAAADELPRLIETIDSGIDVVFPIDSFRHDLLDVGFADVQVHSLGDHVWRGFDAWMAQTDFKNRWCRNWLTAYHQGLIDYYLVTADKP